eukprot:c16424_g1_i2.p1 GENE.c16424_g1_i2~~c16424_g1_i2.p1  ORF type:complete len:515 (+),score=-16.18 c16424_g1_i2:63-1607(+)
MNETLLVQSVSLTPLTRKERIAVNLGVIFISVFEAVRSAYSSPFFLDVVGMSGSSYGVIYLISRCWDAITDPLMGYLTDTTKSKFGRRKPWILLFLLPFSFSYILLWVRFTSNAYYFLVVFILFETFSTMVTVPYIALLTEMSVSFEDATSLASYRFFLTFLSIAIFFGVHGIILSQNEDSEEDGYFLSALVASITFIPLMLISLYYCKEKGELRADAEANTDKHISSAAVNIAEGGMEGDSSDKRNSLIIQPISEESRKETEKLLVTDPFWDNIRHVLRVKNYWIVVSVYLAFTVAGGFSSFSSIIYAENVLGITGGLLIIMQTFPLLITLVAIPIVSKLAAKHGKKKVMLYGLIAQIIISFASYPITEEYRWVYIGLSLINSMASPCVIVIPYSCLSDIVDVDESENGMRRDGTFFSIWNFLGKILGSLAVAISGFMLDEAGYISDESSSSSSSSEEIIQNDDVLRILALLQTVIPACMLCFGLIFLRFYALDKETHEAALRNLECRNKQKT